MSWEQTIDTLNAFLRDEVAAVAAYEQALRRLGWSERTEELNACLRSHRKRVATLREQILQLGGLPTQSSGAWGAFTTLLDGAPASDDDRETISALEEGEDHGLKLYLDDVWKLDQESRKLIEREVLPEQMRTQDSLSDLRLTLTE
jgi:hypothetical protein